MFRIYHTSDLHNRLGFRPRIQAIRMQSPGLLIDCGDSLRGSQTVYHRHEPIIDEMNATGYDLGVPGNREFHYLYALMQARLEKIKRPLICSNLVDTFRRPLPFAKDYCVSVNERHVIRFFGLTVEQYPFQSPWERLFGWRFLDPFEIAKKVALSTSPDETLVLLSHLGLAMDRRIAQAVPRINLILGGHSHDTLHEPELVAGVTIVHAGPYGRYLSATDIEHDPERGVRIDSSLIPLLPQDGKTA